LLNYARKDDIIGGDALEGMTVLYDQWMGSISQENPCEFITHQEDFLEASCAISTDPVEEAAAVGKEGAAAVADKGTAVVVDEVSASSISTKFRNVIMATAVSVIMSLLVASI